MPYKPFDRYDYDDGGAMRHWLQKLLCFHLYWNPDPFPPSEREWYEREWQCSACGKRVIKETNWLPVNFIL